MNAAAAQGLAYGPLAQSDDGFGFLDLDRTVTAAFSVTDPLSLGDPCSDGSNYTAAGGTNTVMAATPSPLTLTTAQTRVQPTVEWSCEAGKLYTLVLFDAGSQPVAKQPGGAYCHWVQINIPCGNGGMASATGGAVFGDINFFPPANPEVSPHNYGFYVAEQRAALSPSQDDIARFPRAGFNMRDFFAYVSDKGPVARTWAWITVSPFSAYQLGFVSAAYRAFACSSLSENTAPVVAHWKSSSIDYTWDATHRRDDFISRGAYIPGQNVITGIKVAPVSGDKVTVFLTVPRWLPGVPSTLNSISVDTSDLPVGGIQNVPLIPFPSWEMQEIGGDCSGLQYVQSMEIDPDGNMWVIDVGRINIFDPTVDNTCPPKLVVLDSRSGAMVDNPYIFPDNVASHTTNFLNDIVIDHVRGLAYISDTSLSGGLIVYDRTNRRSQRFADAATMSGGSDFQWSIGGNVYPLSDCPFCGAPINGIALMPSGDRVFYGPLSKVHVYSVDALPLRTFHDNTVQGAAKYHTEVLATLQDHGLKPSPSDGLVFTCDEKLVYGGLTTASVYTWDTATSSDVSRASSVLSADAVTTNWVDTFGFATDGSLWFTANHLNLLFTTGVPGDVYVHRYPSAAEGGKINGSYINGACAAKPTPRPLTTAPSNGDNNMSVVTVAVIASSIGAVVIVIVYVILCISFRRGGVNNVGSKKNATTYAKDTVNIESIEMSQSIQSTNKYLV